MQNLLIAFRLIALSVSTFTALSDCLYSYYVLKLYLRKATAWMKTGERLVVGLVGCIWSGVQGSDGLCADRVDSSTVYEELKHLKFPYLETMCQS